MINITDNISMVGASELRTQMPKLTKDIKLKTIIVTKKGKPVAVLEDFDIYEEKKKVIDLFEDIVLGYLARERDQNSKDSDFITEEEVLKKNKLFC